jgi:hypothetical protein
MKVFFRQVFLLGSLVEEITFFDSNLVPLGVLVPWWQKKDSHKGSKSQRKH